MTEQYIIQIIGFIFLYIPCMLILGNIGFNFLDRILILFCFTTAHIFLKDRNDN